MIMADMIKKDIVVKQVLMSGDGTPAFVEYYSHVDSRTHIINANRFTEIFGFSLDELKQLQAQKEK